MKDKKLIFFFSDETCSATSIVAPTLSTLANDCGYDFESYICVRPDSWLGEALPLIGNNHMTQFLYLANFYDEILFCSLSNYKSFQFRREILAFGGKVISERGNDEVFDFYKDVFTFLGKNFPKTAIVVPDNDYDKNINITPYCYPDIKRENAIGISESMWKSNAADFKNNGVETAYSLYCNAEDTIVMDEMTDDDSFASITTRIAERNVENATQIAFIDPASMMRWQTEFCRKNIVTLYEPYNWFDLCKVIKRLCDKVNNIIVPGCQMVYREKTQKLGCNDDVITELSKHGLIMNLLGVSPRVGFNLQSDKRLPLDWMESDEAPTPWDDEYSDEFLLEKIRERAIPVCCIFYAADLGHLPILSNFINMMCLDGMRGGILFPSTFYDYDPYLIEQLYIPLKQGGVCPNLEPMISSVGVAVATEAQGYISPENLTKLISTAKEHIASLIGERRVPKGYYPFQDSDLLYKKNTGEPQYEVISKLGFEYSFTHKDFGDDASVKYDDGNMMVLSQKTTPWFPTTSGKPINRLKEWEANFAKKHEDWENGGSYDYVDWLALVFDTPFYSLTPVCYGQFEPEHWKGSHLGMNQIYEVMHYVRKTGGESGRLFLLKPHELYRFAKLADKEGLLKKDF